MSVEKYRIALCDDDSQFADYMEKLLVELCGGRAEIYKYSSGEALTEDLERKHQLIVMDIGLGGMDGFKTSKLVREKNRDAVLVFCSGQYEPLPEFFEAAAYRYLKKEYTEERLREELSAAVGKLEERFGHDFLPAKDTEGRIRQIQVKDIAYISKSKRGSTIHTAKEQGGESGKYLCKRHLRELYEELGKAGFGRPGQQLCTGADL